ncbi:MAG: mobile mystery protein B [Gemmatimonadota bacterium]
MKADDLAAGQTPLDPDEADDLIPGHIGTKAELNEWEQANIADALVWLGRRQLSRTVLTLEFLRALHHRMFGKTWRWAGKFRSTAKSIGLPASQIPEAIANLIENTRHQIEHHTPGPEEIALRFHHALVRIHPFANGNGRHARAMTDQLLKQLGQPPFTWGAETLGVSGRARTSYIKALRQADNGSYDELRNFVRS